MSRAAIMDKVQEILQGLADFDDADVTVCDWTVLDRGSPPYAVVYPGDWTAEDYAFGGEDAVKFNWIIQVDLYERYLNMVTSYEALETLQGGVLTEFLKYPTLDDLDGVQKARPGSGDEPALYFDREGGGPHFVATTMRIVVEELVDITGGEY